MPRYKSRETAFNGIAKFISLNTSIRNLSIDMTKNIMVEFRNEHKPGSLISTSVAKNADYCQKHFKDFRTFIKNKYVI